MFCLFWLSSAALCDSIAEIVTEHKKSTPRNLLPAPDQSGQSEWARWAHPAHSGGQ